ncbi:MAG TPA: MFS transporter [Steroidobacteraceae bacterium]|nr:MFS transporter [Steroidobacteraceae bacterium]
MTAGTSADIAARLDRLPSSRAVWTIVVLISLGCVFEFYDLFFTAYVAPGMIEGGLFTADSLGFFAALKFIRVAGFGTFVFSTFIGLWFGVVMFGQAADRFGRKAVFTWSLIWYCACTAIMACQRSGLWLNIWRLVAGVGFGVQLVTVDTYLSELVPRTLRGRAFSINQLISFCIVPVVALLAWLLVPVKPLGVDGWRWVVAFGSVGALAVWALRSGIPESPRWLAGNNREEEADAIVSAIELKVAAQFGGALPAPVPSAPVPSAPVPSAPVPSASVLGTAPVFADIFAHKYRRRTLVLCIFNAAQSIGFYGFNSWVPSLLIARGVNVTRGLEYAFIIALSQPFGPLLGSFFADKFERKHQIVGGLAGMAVLMTAFAVATSPAALIPIGIAFTLAANIMSYAYHGYQAELFPTRIRSRAVGFVYSWSRIAAAFSGLIVGSLLATGGVPAVAVFIGGAMLVGIALIGVFGPTTNGLALEQLND